jgi:DNA-binding MarR family transcriptional regulator
MPSKASPDLDTVAEALLRASRVLVGVAAESLDELGDEVTLPQFRMLVVLDHAPRGLTALAGELGVNASTALRMADRLVKAGLVRREPAPGDRRQVVLDLTEAGHALVQRVTNRRRDRLAHIAGGMSAQERTAAVAALHAFAEAAGEPEVPHATWARQL